MPSARKRPAERAEYQRFGKLIDPLRLQFVYKSALVDFRQDCFINEFINFELAHCRVNLFHPSTID